MAVVSAVAVGAAAVVEQLADRPSDQRISHRVTQAGYVSAEVGCVEDLAAGSLDELLDDRFGPSIGMDAPRVIELETGRSIWIFQDAYLDYTGETERSAGSSGAQYVHNVLVEQRQGCFRLLHRGTAANPQPFEVGDGDTPTRFFWPLGGGLGADGRVYIFWSEIHHGPDPGPFGGIPRHPDETWLAAYDPDSLQRLHFDRAPNPGVRPQYGSAVVSTTTHTYLFGNSNVLNLAVEGLHGGPYSGTSEYLARVPKGSFLTRPEYRTATGWSPDPAAAVPISQRFTRSNSMQPRRLHDRWVSVTKVDEFWSDRLVVDVARRPWGPWTTVHERTVEPEAPWPLEPEDLVSYQPVLMPWTDDGGVIVVISQNAAEPATHRPTTRRHAYGTEAFAVELDDQLRGT